MAVSILLPTYNGAAFLTPQLESIAAQTLADHEVVVADDGSSDDTVVMLHKAAAKDPRIRIVVTKGNVGQKQRLRELAQAARYPLIAVADQDDVWKANKLELLVTALDGADATFGASWIIDSQGREQGYTLLDELYPIPAPHDRLLYLFKPSASAHGMIMRRALFSDASLANAEPFDWLQSLDAVFGKGLLYVPEAITYHRVHGGNQSNGGLGVRQTLLHRLRPENMTRYRNRLLADRWGLTKRLEYLAYSRALTPDVQTVFMRAFTLCHAAWFSLDRGRKFVDHTLVNRLMSLLSPLAGSAADSEFAQARLLRLARSHLHPTAIVTDLGRAAIGPSALRRKSISSSH